MDPIAIGIIVVVIAGIAWIVFKSDDSDTPAPAPAPNPVTPPKTPGKLRAKQAAKPSVKTLPGNAALNSLTKAGLEDLGRDMGVELDKRKTKANMIVDLKAGVKK